MWATPETRTVARATCTSRSESASPTGPRSTPTRPCPPTARHGTSLRPNAREGVIPTERIQRLLDPSFVDALGGRALDDLRSMKAECTDVENALSYLRRLAQARIEILKAEHERRVQGGNLGDLVNDLPRILSAESGRSTFTDTRVPPPDAPGVELHWP